MMLCFCICKNYINNTGECYDPEHDNGTSAGAMSVPTLIRGRHGPVYKSTDNAFLSRPDICRFETRTCSELTKNIPKTTYACTRSSYLYSWSFGI